MEEQNKLEADFEFYATATKEHTAHLTVKERNLVQRWLHKLRNSKMTTIDDYRLRCELAYYLLKHCQFGRLNGAFTQPPPHESLKWMEKHLMDDELVLFGHAEYRKMATVPPAGTELFEREPDKGGFLVGTPMPLIGAICILSITSRIPKK